MNVVVTHPSSPRPKIRVATERIEWARSVVESWWWYRKHTPREKYRASRETRRKELSEARFIRRLAQEVIDV